MSHASPADGNPQIEVSSGGMADRTILMIPGPIELDTDVLGALAQPQRGHMDGAFAKAFGRALGRAREVFLAPSAQPFVIAGSGTLAMEIATANLIDPGERAVVVNTGYFGDRMRAILERQGARVDEVRAPLGDVPDLGALERTLAGAPAKLVAVTHVDTSTGVRAPVEEVARIAREHGALTVVDGVCSVGGEELRQEAWGIDVALTASQKALGAPPGLALVVASPRALAARRAKKVPVRVAVPRLARVAADHGVLREGRAAVLRDAGDEPGPGARREPGPARRRGNGRALRPPCPPGGGVPRGVPRAGAVDVAGARRDRRQHAERVLLPRRASTRRWSDACAAKGSSWQAGCTRMRRRSTSASGTWAR